MHLTTVHRTLQVHRSPQMHQDKAPHVTTFYFSFWFDIFCKYFLVTSLCSQWTTRPHGNIQLVNKTIANLPYWRLVPKMSRLSLPKLCFFKITSQLGQSIVWQKFPIFCYPFEFLVIPKHGSLARYSLYYVCLLYFYEGVYTKKKELKKNFWAHC